MTARIGVALIDGDKTTFSEFGHDRLPADLREQELARVIRGLQRRHRDQGIDVKAADWINDDWQVRT